MDKLKFKKFGWNQVKDVSDINLYDYIKNRMFIGLVILCVMAIASLMYYNFNIFIVSFFLITITVFFILYFLISFEIFKKYYLVLYIISSIIPSILYITLIIYNLYNENKINIIILLLFIYFIIWLLCWIAIKRFNKHKIKKVSNNTIQLIIIPIGFIMGYYVNKIDNDIFTYIFILLLSSVVILYVLFQINYVLKSNKNYKYLNSK